VQKLVPSRDSVYRFDNRLLLQAKVALYLKASLATSTDLLVRFTQGWESLRPEVHPEGNQASLWIDGSGNIWLFGGEGVDANGNVGSLNDLWKYQPSTR
jgi:hypothetical protein